MTVFPFILKKYYVSFLPNLRGGCKPNSQKVKIVANEVFEFFALYWAYLSLLFPWAAQLG